MQLRPSNISWIMSCKVDLHLCYDYIDDLLIASSNLEEHKQQLH